MSFEDPISLTHYTQWCQPRETKAYAVGIDGDEPNGSEPKLASGVHVQFLQRRAGGGLFEGRARIDLGPARLLRSRIEFLDDRDGWLEVAADELERLRDAVKAAGYRLEGT